MRSATEQLEPDNDQGERVEVVNETDNQPIL